MKKFFAFTFSLFLIAATSFATAGNEPTDKKVAQTFIKFFASAQSVSWNKAVTYTQANFLMNGQYLSAYFAPDASMLGVSRNLTSLELPLTLMADLKKNYEGFWITELFEYGTPDSDAYYVTLENADKKLILKSNSGRFSIYKNLVK